MRIRKAILNDNEGLLALTKSCPMDGNVKLRIDREPDYFSLLKLKGKYVLLVAVEKEEIIGAIAFHEKKSFINGLKESTGYISDLKVLPRYRNTTVTFRLIKAVFDEIQQRKIKLTYILTAKGNTAVQKIFEGRAGLPMASKVTDFQVLQFPPKKYDTNYQFNIIPFGENYRSQAVDLLNIYYKSYQFGTCIENSEKIEGDQAWIIMQNGVQVGFISVIDMTPHKQNVVLNIPFLVYISLKIYGLFIPQFRIPKVNESIQILHVMHLAVAPGFSDYAIPLIQHARFYASKKAKTFLSFGLDKKSELFKKVKPLSATSFESEGFLLEISGNNSLDVSKPFHDNFYLV